MSVPVSFTNIQNSNLQTQNNKKTKNKGVLLGLMSASVISNFKNIPAQMSIEKMKEISKISQKDSFKITKAAEEGLLQSGLKDKGVQIFKLKLDKKGDADKTCEAYKAIRENIASFKLFKKFKKESLIDFYTNPAVATIANGNNVSFLTRINKIVTPKEGLETALFHEIGHALNKNKSTILKGTQKLYPLSFALPPAILLVSMFNKRKTTDETSKNDTKIQKTGDFIKRNAGKLILLSTLPMLFEEGIASLRGQKMAKGMVENGQLSKDLFKKIKQTNLCGFSTYAAMAAFTTAGVYTAVKIKDQIQTHYENKQKLKAEKE